MALTHAILVALIDCPSSGYDLAKRFGSSVGFFWDASHQQIYRDLAKLNAAGYVTSHEIEQHTRPNKKVYSVTESGKAHLVKWMTKSSSLAPVKNDLLVKLFGGHMVSVDVLLNELRQHRKQHQRRLTEYQTIEDRLFPDVEAMSSQATYQYLTLRNGIQLEQGWLRWCDEAISTLQTLPELQNEHADDGRSRP